MMKTRKIGECFDYGERKLEVVEWNGSCQGCFFENLPWCDHVYKITGPCLPRLREDKKWVIFKEVKKL